MSKLVSTGPPSPLGTIYDSSELIVKLDTTWKQSNEHLIYREERPFNFNKKERLVNEEEGDKTCSFFPVSSIALGKDLARQVIRHKLPITKMNENGKKHFLGCMEGNECKGF